MNTAARSIVVGAGWSGLAAAVALSRSGRHVTLIEAADRAGGRARTIEKHGRRLDNGQHIGLGAYTAVLELAGMVGLDTDGLFHRLPLAWVQRDTHGVRFALHMPRLPYPFDHLASVLTVRGLDFAARWSLIQGVRRMRRVPEPDCSVSEFLAGYGQPGSLCRFLWEPLCLAALNTPPSIASAKVFARVLEASFSSTRGASDLLLPASDLGAVLPGPVLEWLAGQGADIRLGERVTGLVVDERGLHGVQAGDSAFDAEEVVLALPPDATARLVRDILPEVSANADGLRYQPIATVYLEYDASVRLDPVIQGFQDMTVQWVIDRRVTGTPGMLAAVISAEGPHTGLDSGALASIVADELAACFPEWPRPGYTTVVREKHATFSAEVGVDVLRPVSHTRVEGLWLAGDWTATGLPSTLEGAVRSGFDCARLIT